MSVESTKQGLNIEEKTKGTIVNEGWEGWGGYGAIATPSPSPFDDFRQHFLLKLRGI